MKKFSRRHCLLFALVAAPHLSPLSRVLCNIFVFFFVALATLFFWWYCSEEESPLVQTEVGDKMWQDASLSKVGRDDSSKQVERLIFLPRCDEGSKAATKT